MCANVREPEKGPVVNISFRIRHRRTVAGAAVLTLALGGLAAALPAHASTGSAVAPGNGKIADTLQPNGVTAPDSILPCATSQIAIGGTEAVAVPVGCFTAYNNQSASVYWSGGGVSTTLAQQVDGNLVLYAGNGKVWSSRTTFGGSLEGPGCLVRFQTDGNLVESNCDNLPIWDSVTAKYPNAILAFQADGDLVIYASPTGAALWSTGTDS